MSNETTKSQRENTQPEGAQSEMTLEVSESGGTVFIWFEQLQVYGQGTSLEEAAKDLAQEVLDYIAAWRERLHAAPNHADKKHHVELLGRKDLKTLYRSILTTVR